MKFFPSKNCINFNLKKEEKVKEKACIPPEFMQKSIIHPVIKEKNKKINLFPE
ncbi:hypothetical protein [Blattabacterium cuenoti]|uniref:hypothetical protein n=1 Tax=Blattabacterium cuenoti TaxID=1653831 RepID=UPI00163CC475|nr:hypothetical protein [Blattabacterium cuenoti]